MSRPITLHINGSDYTSTVTASDRADPVVTSLARQLDGSNGAGTQVFDVWIDRESVPLNVRPDRVWSWAIALGKEPVSVPAPRRAEALGESSLGDAGF